MRTITKTYEVYKWEELDEKARDRAYNDYLTGEILADTCHETIREYWDVLDKMGDIFGVKMQDYSVDSSTYWYRFAFRDGFNGCDELEEMRGERLYKYVVNNFTEYFMKAKLFVTRDGDRARKSQCQKEWDDYALTGVCCDYPVARAFADYVATEPDKLADYHDFVDTLLDALFSALQKEIRYYESYGYFEETCRNNDWEFFKDGARW